MPIHLNLPRRARTVRDRQQLAGRIQAARQRAAELQRLDDHQLAATADALRESLVATETTAEENLCTAFALALEALRRTLGVRLFDVQIEASLALAAGQVAEMQTGEGKTLAAVPATVLYGLTGRGVHIVTTNPYLANRDFQLLRATYEYLGLSVALLLEQSSVDEKIAAYQCDITFGVGSEFGFDYLRDQVALRRVHQTHLGESLLQRLRGQQDPRSTVVQRSRAFAIVDEVDNVLIDDAGSPLVLCATPTAEAHDAAVHCAARDLLEQLTPDYHFRCSPGTGIIELTREGKERIYAADISIPVELLRRSWGEYVEQALRAKLLFRRDVHYVVLDQAIRIVDASTGRIFADRTWSEGLHQAIEAKEDLPIMAENTVLAQITRQRFFRLYEKLSGMTGTATGCEGEFKTVYGLDVTPIALRVPSCRVHWPLRSFSHGTAKWAAIVGDVATLHAAGRPVLVGTRTIADSEYLADALRQRGLVFQLLNGRQDAEEATVIATAGQPGTITISTNLAGRGTDIQLTDDVRSSGGLHVIVAEPHESSRMDRQLIGRCGRQGDPGSAQVYVSCDDALIQHHANWLIPTMVQAADASGEVRIDLTRRIRRVQQATERLHYAARMALLRRDLGRDSLMS